MEAQLFESLGRKQLKMEQQDAAYDQLLKILAGVLSGAIDPSRVMVNMTGRGWTVAPEGCRPEPMPGCECILAPEPPPTPPEPA